MQGLRQSGQSAGRLGLAVLLLALCPACADASWLGFKNDTSAAVVIQSATLINGQVRRGKPHVLHPGEMALDAVIAPGIRQIAVYDPNQNNRLIFQDAVNCQNTDIFLSLRHVTPPPVQGKPQPAQLRFIPIQAPALPRGTPGTPPAGGNTGGFTPPKESIKPPTKPPTPPPAPSSPPKPPGG